MSKRILFILLSATLLIVSCRSQFDLLLEGHDVDKKYSTAFQLFEEGKYSKASQLFENLQLATKGTLQEDTILYYTALSKYRFRDYYAAEPIFTTFVNTFPRSVFTNEAKFLRINCMYRATYPYQLDQAPSRVALTNMQEYLIEHPDSEYIPQVEEMMSDLYERLDKKSFESAKIYYTIEDYKASHYALKNVLKDNADNIYREDVLYFICMSSYKYAFGSIRSKQRERYLTFVDDYYNFLTEYPESDHLKELNQLFDKAQAQLKTR